MDFDQYLVKVDGGGRLTRRNRSFLKKIVSTLAHKEEIYTSGGESKKATVEINKKVEMDGIEIN